jgi:type VI secretion system protein VasD
VKSTKIRSPSNCFKGSRNSLLSVGIGVSIVLSGCASSPLVESALGLLGLQSKLPVQEVPPEILELRAKLKPPTVPIRIHAGDKLNSGSGDAPLSLVVKLYKLKGIDSFGKLPYKDFTETTFKNDDVVEAKEIILLAGRKHEVIEPFGKDVTHYAIVALFRSPEQNRWRFVFDVAKSAPDGITVGAHSCAMNVTQGVTVGSSEEYLRLAGTICK